MAPIGVEVGWRPAPAMGDFIARMDASRARVCFSFGVAWSIRIRLKSFGLGLGLVYGNADNARSYISAVRWRL